MVQILEAVEKRPNFGSLLGERLGGGISKGYSDSQEAARKMKGEEAADKRKLSNAIQIEQAKQSAKSKEKRDLLEQLGILKPSEQGMGFGDQISGQGIGQSTEKSKEEQVPLYERLSDDQIAGLATLYPEMGKIINEQKTQKYEKEKDAWGYKPVQDYIAKLDEGVETAMFNETIADEVENLVQTGNVDPWNLRTFLASKFGEDLPFLFTEDTSRLKFIEKLQAKGLKDIFSRPTEREFFFINAAQAQLGKTPQANLAVAGLSRKFAQIPQRAAEYKNQIIEENGGLPPRDLPAKVNKKMQEYRNSLIKESAGITFDFGSSKEKEESIKFLKENVSPGYVVMRLPDGSLGEIPKQNVKAAQEKGAEVL